MPNEVEQPPSDAAAAAVIAVPDDDLDELLDAELVGEIPTLRGPVFDAVVTVGVNAAALVTLMQAPDTIRAFAAWLVSRGRRRRDGIIITGTRGEQAVRLRVDGEVPVEAVADFLKAALEQSNSPGTSDTPPLEPSQQPLGDSPSL